MFSKVLRSWHKRDERFVVKYQILAKTPFVIVVLSLADTSNECQQYIVSGYKQVDHGVPNYEVRLPKKTTVNIESITGSAEVKPSDERPILYSDLKKQNSIHYKVTLQAPHAGDHLLQLRYRSGDSNIHTHPFHVTLEEKTNTVPDIRRAGSTSQLSPSDTQKPVIPSKSMRPEGKFLVKYQILTKGPLVVVIYSLQDTAHACQKFTASGYKCIESGVRNYDVQLPRFSECNSSIESSDPSVEVSPRFEMPLLYIDLKNQMSIQHKVTLLTSSGGRHLLNLCLKRENEILLSDPFHVTLGSDDLCDGLNFAVQDAGVSITNETEPDNKQQQLKPEERFLVNYQILTKGSWIIVIYSLADTTNERHQLISGGYQCIQQGIPNHEVRLPRWSSCTSSIESIGGSVKVKPGEGKNLSYIDLKNQKSVQQSVTLLAQRGGFHLLQLRISNGNEILHTAPFQVTLEYEDLYAGGDPSKPQPSYTNQRQGGEVGVPTADQLYDEIDEVYEIPIETQPKVPVGVTRRPEIEQYDDILLRQSPIPRPRTSIYNPPPLPVNNPTLLPMRPDDFDDDEWDDDDNLYEDVDAEKNSEIPTVTRPQLPSTELERTKQQDTKPLVNQTKKTLNFNTMPSLPLKPGEPTVRGILEKHNVDNYWPFLEKFGIKSVKDFAQLNKEKLGEFSVKTVGDRIRIMNAVESCKSPFISSSAEKKENFAVDELLEKIGMINFKPLFKQERISMELLNAMKDQDFKDIGIRQENDRKAIKQALEGMQGYCDLECHKYDIAE
uniref:uncharacterized protein LOC120328835 n=1 Tax=Styela clava TaxID=7725 RepID=UPI00193AD84B|nr:uncharacterized protein LOC120328835 [Styela clava]